MKPEIKKTFLELLRSGKFTQAYSILKVDDTCYCAEGLICESLVRHGIGEWNKDNVYSVNGEESCITLRKSVLNAAGMKNDQLFYDKKYNNMWDINDNANLSFEEIADLVEAQW